MKARDPATQPTEESKTNLLGEEEEEEREKINERHEELRFGSKVHKLKLGNALRSIGIIMAILLVPL